MDVDSGQVIDWQPPQPDENHEWNAVAKRWVKRADVEEREAQRRYARIRIEELERQQLRPLRELALDPKNERAVHRIVEIEAEIASYDRTCDGLFVRSFPQHGRLRLMHGHFKFLNSEHLPKLLGGSLRLSSLAWFRYLERKSGSPWIGDRMEGLVRYEGEVTTSPSNFERLSRLGIKDTSAGGNIVKGLTRVHRHCFVFCFSSGSYPDLRESMCGSNVVPEERYDASVRIVNPNELADRIYASGRIVELDDEPVRAHFDPPLVGKVLYEPRTTDLADAREIEASPFAKEERFHVQSETRMVFYPHDRYLRDQLTITVPADYAAFETVESSMECGRKSVVPHNQGRGAQDFHALADEIDSWWAVHRVERPNLAAYMEPGVSARLADVNDPMTRECSRIWREYTDRELAALRSCADQFGDRILELYWYARINCQFDRSNYRDLDCVSLVHENMAERLRELGTECFQIRQK